MFTFLIADFDDATAENVNFRRDANEWQINNLAF